jgi:hypothetical protein
MDKWMVFDVESIGLRDAFSILSSSSRAHERGGSARRAIDEASANLTLPSAARAMHAWTARRMNAVRSAE